jgi:hypothetical protein
MVEKIALTCGSIVTILLLLMQQGYSGATWQIYLNCFKVGAIVFLVIFVPGKLMTMAGPTKR